VSEIETIRTYLVRKLRIWEPEDYWVMAELDALAARLEAYEKYLRNAQRALDASLKDSDARAIAKLNVDDALAREPSQEPA
jgi:hypothetical protein